MDAIRIRIRTAGPSDLDGLQDVFRRASLSNAGDRADLLAHPDALVLTDDGVREGRTRVASAGDVRIVGFVTTRPAGGALELEDLFVDPDWMRRGIATALVADAVATARAAGMTRLEVTANPHAAAFYRTAGFVHDRDVDTRFGPAPRLRLDLAPRTTS